MKRSGYLDAQVDGAFRNTPTEVYSSDSSGQRRSRPDQRALLPGRFYPLVLGQQSCRLCLCCIIFSFIISMQTTKLVKTSFSFFTHSPQKGYTRHSSSSQQVTHAAINIETRAEPNLTAELNDSFGVSVELSVYPVVSMQGLR